ncbi:coiled-coil domain-containing protein 33-like [Symsagittifera roscoffensis]|uniref:coiled-coil domain-containing protein 33-like n=1 Tax=Symsagittifera roscoffensis TaxID=84072 RepID=UPI00307C4130
MAAEYNRTASQPPNEDDLPPEESMNNALGGEGNGEGFVYRVPKGDNPAAAPPRGPIGDIFNDYDYDGGSNHFQNADRYQRPPAGEFDDRAMRIIDLQMQDLENYRRAVKKMSEDILKLREQVSKTEGQNSQLRRQVMMGEESSKALLNVAELEGISKADLIDRYIALRRKLAEVSNEVKVYKDKVQILQNQVIKKNDKEKSFIQLQQAHTAQQALLMKYQDKSGRLKQLEETVRAQEKVIAKMEKLMQHKGTTLKQADEQRQKIEEALKSENDRLRTELRKEREQRQQLEHDEADRIARENELNVSPLELARLRSLDAELEDKDLKYMALQKALEDNSRMWGREKEELLRRITELERGFARSPVMILGHPSLNKPHLQPHTNHNVHTDRLMSPHYRPKNWPSRLEPIS